MADKTQNTTDIGTVVTAKSALVTDLNTSYINEQMYSYARNVVRNSKDGDIGTIGNEPSTIACYSAPYQIVGVVALPDGTDLVMSGDGINSEIGIGDPKLCTYKTLKNMDCLGFNPGFPITGAAKQDFNKSIVATLISRDQKIRRFDLNKLPAAKDCNDLLLFRNLVMPCISVKKGQTGNMPDGVYSVVMAYAVDGQVFTDWFGITNRIQLNNASGSNSLEITIDNLDKGFSQYMVAVVGNYIDPSVEGATKVAKIIGTFSTNTKTISLTDFINDTYQPLLLSTLINKRTVWQTAGIISSNSNYLLLGDLVGRPEENYQPKAMTIKAEYVVEQVEEDYYENDGEDVGYYRDENYDFYIQGIYATGDSTEKFHIPGRKATSTDRALVASADVFEYDDQFDDCTPPGRIERWQIENTASALIPQNNKFKCNRRVLGTGTMGYVQSTDRYPDNLATMGEDANDFIRFHKMPDECKVPRYSYVDGKRYINIIGVRFKDIPKFDSPDIVGYKITRSDRKGGNGTVVARGLMTNMRYYDDAQAKARVMYANYTVNDLSPDQYLSSTQTVFKQGKETNFTPLEGYYKDRFSFYSPHTQFEPRYSLGTEFKFEAEEIASVTGRFEKVHEHPRQKLMNQFAFWISAAVGFIQTTITLLGKTDIRTVSGFKLSVPPERYTEIHGGLKIENVNDLISITPAQIASMVVKAVESLDGGGVLAILNLVKVSLQALAAVGLKIPFSILAGTIEADRTMKTIIDFTGYTDYVYQYNAHAKFDRSVCITAGNKRRRTLTSPKYIPSDVVTVDDTTLNNYFREKMVYVHLNKEVADPVNIDNTRNTMSGFGVCGASGDTTSTGSAFYVTNKVPNPNQYGTLGSAMPVSIHSCTLSAEDTPILYGGDCVIARSTFLKKMQFFNQNIAGTNYLDGTEYDYRMYRNIGYPRFWADFTKYDFSSLLAGSVVNYAKFNRTTAAKHNLDCKKKRDGESISRIDDAYMYLSNNCAMDFICEVDYNISFREATEHPFFSKKNTNLSQIFRQDKLEFPEEFKINRVYSDLYTTEIFAQQQRADFDPANPIPVSQPNSVIYSLPSFNMQQADNWQYFLPANMFNFRESDYGRLTGMHKIDQDRIIFLFSKSSPYLSVGRDFLQLEGSGRKVTIGDGGLFAQDPREIMPTDNNYGACNSPYAFSNTHMGRFYPSENQGRIINYGNDLDDISRQGMSYWCKNYMPIRLYSYFPNYPTLENPIGGVGYLTAFDSFNETIYITKRDFSPKREFVQEIIYDTQKGFSYQGIPISLRDSYYFDDISWTLSYSPLDKGFTSWHDWHPDWTIQRDNHFHSVKGNTVYKHNEAYDSYCNFYGVDYPHEIGFISTSGQQVHTVRSLEYLLEVYTYKNGGRDKFHVHHENFDRLRVKNTEQVSPILNLIYGTQNPEENLDYPRKSPINQVSWDVLFFKERNKYTVNQFWDSTRDRGEFTGSEVHLQATDESGYKSVVNPVALDINKPEEQRKKFRHYWNEFRLTKTISGPYKFISKIYNIKKQISI